MTVKLETQAIRTMGVFEKVTRVHPKDCLIMDNCIYFLVDTRKVGLAVGKNGSTAKELSGMFKKHIRLFGYSDDPETMMRNMIPGLKSIRMDNGIVTVSIESKDRFPVIGKNGENINAIREIMKRHFSIERIRLKI